MQNELPRHLIDDVVLRALEEDLGSGDVTTTSCVSEDARAVAHAVARENLVACGAPVAARVFATLDPNVEFTAHAAEGAKVEPGARLWTARGAARSILMGERVALNFAQRLSAVATTTRRYVEAVADGAKTRITDTRKTTPGLRLFERYAVRAGGGRNHRDNLGSAVLIKDNHIVAAGGVEAAIRRAREHASHTSRIECEVDTLAQLEVALSAGADVALLDNMDTETVRRAVAITQGRALLEASGGITLARVRELSLVGVDVISVGALTHSAASVDIGLDFEA